MNLKDTMGFLGICRKAGKLLCGHDVVKESINSSSAQLVFLSADASDRLEKEMRYLCTCNGKNIPLFRTQCTMEEFGISLGKKSAVFSVTDTGFATKILQKFGEELDDNKI
jgi:ribosomal protein L7Ae-like RNA K-turn-binding protein